MGMSITPVELEGVEDHPHRHPGAGIGPRVPDEGGDGGDDPVGQDHLLEVAPQHPLEAQGQSFPVKGMGAVEGPGQVPEPADGPLDELGEEAQEEGQLEGVLLGGHRAPVDVDEVAHRLEGIKRDSQGQGQAHKGELTPPAQQGEDPADVSEEEAGVLHHHQDAQVQQEAEGHPPEADALLTVLVRLFFLFGELGLVFLEIGALPGQVPADAAPGQVGGRRGGQEIGEKLGPRRGIKEITGRQQQRPLALLRQQVIGQEENYREAEKFI